MQRTRFVAGTDAVVTGQTASELAGLRDRLILARLRAWARIACA